MTQFNWKEVSVSIEMTASELDRPQRLRDPIWRGILVDIGVMRPRYGKTLRQDMDDLANSNARHMKAAYAEASSYGMGLEAFLNNTRKPE